MSNMKVLESTFTKSDNMGNIEVEHKIEEIKGMDRENYMQIYVDKFQFISKLEGKTIKILALMMSNCVTYNDNELNLSSIHRAEIMKKLNITNSQITRALSELCDKGFLKKESLNKRLIKYKLNPHVFGYASFNTIRRQRMDFKYYFDFDSLEIKEKIVMDTEYNDNTKSNWIIKDD